MSQVAMIESETGASLPKLCRSATWSAHTWRCSEIFGWFLPRFGPKQLGVTREKRNWFTDLVHVIHVIDMFFACKAAIYPHFPCMSLSRDSLETACACARMMMHPVHQSALKGEVRLENMYYRLNDQIEKFWSFSFPETNSSLLNIGRAPKEIWINFIFHPFMFRGELLVSGRLSWHIFDIKVLWCSCSSQVHPARKIPTSTRFARPWRMATMATFDLQIWSFVAFLWWKTRQKKSCNFLQWKSRLEPIEFEKAARLGFPENVPKRWKTSLQHCGCIEWDMHRRLGCTSLRTKVIANQAWVMVKLHYVVIIR